MQSAQLLYSELSKCIHITIVFIVPSVPASPSVSEGKLCARLRSTQSPPQSRMSVRVGVLHTSTAWFVVKSRAGMSFPCDPYLHCLQHEELGVCTQEPVKVSLGSVIKVALTGSGWVVFSYQHRTQFSTRTGSVRAVSLEWVLDGS